MQYAQQHQQHKQHQQPVLQLQQATAALVAAQQRAGSAQATKSSSEASTKRQRQTDLLPTAPEGAVSLKEVLINAATANRLQTAATSTGAAGGLVPSSTAAVTAAAASAAVEGPSSTIEEIFRQLNSQVRADEAAAAEGSSAAGRGHGGGGPECAGGDAATLTEASIERLLELLGLDKVRAEPTIQYSTVQYIHSLCPLGTTVCWVIVGGRGLFIGWLHGKDGECETLHMPAHTLWFAYLLCCARQVSTNKPLMPCCKPMLSTLHTLTRDAFKPLSCRPSCCSLI